MRCVGYKKSCCIPSAGNTIIAYVTITNILYLTVHFNLLITISFDIFSLEKMKSKFYVVWGRIAYPERSNFYPVFFHALLELCFQFFLISFKQKHEDKAFLLLNVLF